jgi:hypothetical protein
MKKFLYSLTIIFFSISILCKADEGMWLPLLINKNLAEMQKLGLKLTAEDIYNVNNSSLKDAIVNFGNFCTGEVISKEGLVLTNHHCGFDAIQSQSSVQNDLLTNGFWAMTRDQELASPGLTVTFLIRMEDVTQKILSNLNPGMDLEAREKEIENLSEDLIKAATDGKGYDGEVKSFFEGNQYYLFIYEIYKDVRMVGAPPSSIGKFGGDTDNWMWPRHTGDFSLFRIYTGPDGKPAEYSKNNIPLKPKHHLPISLKGVKEGDFSMVLGYPGGTERYLPSEGVKLAYNQSNPAKIKIREQRLSIMKKDMDASEEIKIKYAAKYAHISNYYKYFIGQNQGLKRLDIVGKKKREEEKFQSWVKADPGRTKEYGNLLSDYEKIYKDYSEVNLPYIYLEEAAFGTEIIELAYKFGELYGALKSNASKKEIDEMVKELQTEADKHFKNYNAATDKKIFAALLKMYYEDIAKAYHPSIFGQVEKKFKGNFNKFAEFVFKNSILSSKDKVNSFLATPTAKTLEKDPAFRTMSSIIAGFHQSVAPSLRKVNSRLEVNNHTFMEALMKMQKDENMYPDANFTMRLTYGTVQDYYPQDAVHYLHKTTLKGVMEKEDPSNEEFIVADKLKELFAKKDFGNYAQNGEMYVCFITNNDITGGNSGSPVINGEGHLIGIAFDGNWEAMSGDIIFEPELQRCISTDIRYVLFIMEKFAGAGYLVKEMTLVESPEIPSKLKDTSLNERKETPLKENKENEVKTKEKKSETVY